MRSTGWHIVLSCTPIFALLGFGTAHAATTFNVPTVAYPTIQAAIDAAADGDTIKVAAGLYAESLNVNKKVSIEGSGKGTNALVDTIIDPIAGNGIYIRQPVNLKNLRVTGATADGIRVERATTTPPRLAFTGVTWENIASSGNALKGVEIHNFTDVSDMEILDSEFNGNVQQGLRSASDVTVNGMVITDSTFNGNSYRLYLQGTINGLTISGSSLNLNTAWGLYMSETGPIQNVAIEYSSFNNNAGWGLVVWTPGAINNVSITRSSIDNVAAMDLPNGGGLWVEGESGTTNTSATCNWWGAVDGPGLPLGPGGGDAVGGVVLFTPWLTGSDLNNAACSGGTSRGIKQLVVIDLGALSADAATERKIREALTHIQRSLNAKLWADDSHLTASGQKVFEHEKHAVQKLLEIESPPSLVLDAIDELVNADEILASLAVAEADSTPGADPTFLAKAHDEIGKANAYLGTGDPVRAIEHFKKAWQYAMRAL